MFSYAKRAGDISIEDWRKYDWHKSVKESHNIGGQQITIFAPKKVVVEDDSHEMIEFLG